ncbi:MAG: DoxX family protein [Flavobacteriales bacterium]|nr:DoxX family protein [Flavobacteriales bacterium]
MPIRTGDIFTSPILKKINHMMSKQLKSLVYKLITIEANKDIGILAFRLLAVFSLIKAHGLPKIINFQETLTHIPDPLGMGSTFSAYYAVFANVFCAILIAAGLFTRIAAIFILSITLSGLLIVHLNDPAKLQDMPLIYSIVFGFIAYTGAGKYSLDHNF